MKFLEYIRLALSEIFHNKARTFLTLIGIIIGISAVIIIIFVVQGAETYVMSELEKIAPVDLMQVYNRYDSSSQRLLGQMTFADLEYLKEKEKNNIRAIAPRYSGSGTLRYDGRESDFNLITTTPAFKEIYDLELAQGRFLNELDVENLNQVIVLGYETAEDIFKKENAIGKKVILNNITFTVIGVLPKDYESPILPISINDNRGFIPITVMERLMGVKNRFSILIRVKDRKKLAYMQNKVIKHLDIRHGLTSKGQSKFSTYNMVNGLDMVNIIKIVLLILLGGVASITLLVAGIGVMNIMLVIVTERTREIGLRKALGANKKDILLQFIIESIILCFVGGIIGILLGHIGSDFILNIAKNYIQLEADVPFWASFVSLIFTSFVGLFFGIYPALKAARLNPIDALHYE